MNAKRVFTVTLITLLTSFAMAEPFSSREKANYQEWIRIEQNYPKTQSPTSFSDLNMKADAKLVWSDIYLDGGTKGFLFKDSEGNYLAFATGPGLQSKDHPKRIDSPTGSRLFVFALHYSDEEAILVETGSPCEVFLKSLIKKGEG